MWCEVQHSYNSTPCRQSFTSRVQQRLPHGLIITTAATLDVLLAGAADFEGEAGPEPAAGWADMISECWESEPEKRCVCLLYAMHG